MKRMNFRAPPLLLAGLLGAAVAGAWAGETLKPATDGAASPAAPAARIPTTDAARKLEDALARAGEILATTQPAEPAVALGKLEAEPAGALGKLEIPETIFNAGTVDRGTIIRHAFELKNVGAGTLTVDAKPGCGCTVLDFDKTIPPGGVGKVTAKLRTGEFKGEITKSIVVTSDDATNATVTLQMKAHVRVAVEVEPEVVVIDAKYGKVEPVTVTITGTEGDPFDIVTATWTDARFEAAITPVLTTESGKPAPKVLKPSPGTLASGSRIYKVIIRPTQDIPVGRFKSTLTLTTTHPKALELPISVFATIRGNIDVSAQEVALRVGPGAREPEGTQRVVIRKTKLEGRPLEITSTTSSSPSIKATLRTTTEGQEYDLEIKYDGPPPAGILAERVTVKTNDPKQQSIEIVVNVVTVPMPATKPATAKPATARPAATKPATAK